MPMPLRPKPTNIEALRTGVHALGLCTLAVGLSLWLTGCQTQPGPKSLVYQNERFEENEVFSRLFDATPDKTCAAAQRALLSQGYMLSGGTRADTVVGRKNFQPEGEVHVQIEFHIVCSVDGREGKLSTAFVNAIQDRYVIKRNPSSASLGVNAIGSVSIPLGSSEDALVKVSSETIPAGTFYDRFFALVERYLRDQSASE